MEMENHENNSEAAALRQKAVELLKHKPSKHDSQLSDVENLQLYLSWRFTRLNWNCRMKDSAMHRLWQKLRMTSISDCTTWRLPATLHYRATAKLLS